MVEVQVIGGEIGAQGSPGQFGTGGLGGIGGTAGNGGTYTETRGEKGEQIITKHARNGRAGKTAKKGKNGRPATLKVNSSSKKNNSNLSSDPGAVCFVVLTDAGFKESGGTPFRVVFFREDIPALRPLPSSYPKINPSTMNMLVYKGENSPKTPGMSSMTANPVATSASPVINNEDFGPLIYGQMLILGPIKPINIGGLEAPSPALIAIIELVDFCSMEIAQRLTFTSIPAAEDVRYGKLPIGSEQKLSMLLPNLKDINFNLIPPITAAVLQHEVQTYKSK